MTPINQYDTYTEGMKKSIEDKLFWYDVLSEVACLPKIVVDYGCATGDLLAELEDIPYRYGYDTDKVMITQAENSVPNVVFTTRPPILHSSLRSEVSLLNLSSVIHEIYSYSSPETLIDYIESANFDYIAIRDMALSREVCMRESSKLDRFLLRFAASNDKTLERQLYEYEKLGHDITYQEDLIHFLLKYRYTANWSREVKENYLPLTVEDYLEYIERSKIYEVMYQEHYTLPFLAKSVRADLGIDLKDKTHLKLLLRRKRG